MPRADFSSKEKIKYKRLSLYNLSLPEEEKINENINIKIEDIFFNYLLTLLVDLETIYGFSVFKINIEKGEMFFLVIFWRGDLM